MLEVKQEMNFEDLKNNCWSGAITTLTKIEEEGKEEELMNYLEDIFYDNVPTMTELNDCLWFDDESIYDALGIAEEDEEEEEEEEE